MRVMVYRNLHRKCWSVKALEGPQRGRVIAHRDSVCLQGATFKVGEAGRQRVIREQRKNVHAGVVGVLVERELHTAHTLVSYNPYRAGHFYRKSDGSRIDTATAAHLHSDGSVWAAEPLN